MRNYDSLKSSEHDIVKRFWDYVLITVKIHREVITILENMGNEEIWNLHGAKIDMLENQSNVLQANILDESVWVISKEQPQANHLRLMISVMGAINDLERICDYAQNIKRYLGNHKSINKFYSEKLLKMEKQAYNGFVKIFNNLKQADAHTTYNLAQTIFNEFQQTYRSILLNLKQHETEHGVNREHLVDLVLVSKNIERIIDHALNVVEYFIYVRDAGFFLQKSKN